MLLLLLLLLLVGLQATQIQKNQLKRNNPLQKEILQHIHSAIFARLLKQTTAVTIKKKKEKKRIAGGVLAGQICV